MCFAISVNMTKNINTALLALSLFACNPQTHNFQNSVDSGRTDYNLTNSIPVDLNQNPEWAQSLVNINPKESDSCNGILIAPFKILTSAHCYLSDNMIEQGLYKFDKNTTKIFFDKDEITSNQAPQITGQHISSIELHPDYISDQITRISEYKRLTSENTSGIASQLIKYAKSDLAIITLNRSALSPTLEKRFSQTASFAIIDDGSLQKWDDNGSIKSGLFDYALNLSYTVFAQLSHSRSENVYLNYAKTNLKHYQSLTSNPALISSTQRLLNDSNTAPDKGRVKNCNGDSGSPLFFKLSGSSQYMLVGIATVGINLNTNAFENCPSLIFYLQLSMAREWINSQINK